MILTVTAKSTTSFQYDGFLSYSTGSDYQTARRVEVFLESFHKLTPPAGAVIRRLQICRDGSDFRLPKSSQKPSASDPIWEIIESQLEKAQYLLVLCSPAAVTSPWVAREIAWFVEHRGPNWVLPLLSAGRDPIASPEECFPKALIAEGIQSARIWYDLRGRRPTTADQRVRDYEDEMARLAGDLLEWDAQTFGPLSTLWQREQLRTRRRHAQIVTGVAAVVLVLASFATWSALEAREEALRARVASLVSLASSQKDPMTSALVLNEVASLAGDSAPPSATSLAARLLVAKRPIAVLRGHEGAVVSVMFNGAGNALLTASLDGTARIWRIDASGESIVLKHSNAPLTSATFSHDGRRIVTVATDGGARIWNGDGTGKPIVLQGHDQALRMAGFSPDDTRVVTASNDGTARVWRVADGVSLAVLRGHRAAVRSAVFSSKGDHILTASDDGTCRLWAIDGASSQKTFDFATGLAQFSSASFSPDQSKIIVASSEGTGWILSPTGEFAFISLIGDSSPISSALYSPDGKWIVTAWQSGRVRLWDAEELKPLGKKSQSNFEFQTPSPARKAIFSPDSSRGAVITEDGSAYVWPLDRPEERLALGRHDGPVLDIAFSPDGTRLATASSDATIRIWEAGPSSEPIEANVHRGPINRVQFDSIADRVLTQSKDGTLWLWRRDGSGFIRIGHEDTPAASADLNVQGTHVAIVAADASVTVLDANTLRTLTEFSRSITPMRFASVNADGTAIVTISDENAVQLWHPSRTEPVLSFQGHEGAVNSVRFSPDGHRIVTAGDDTTIRVWDTDGHGEPMVFRGHQSAVTNASFGPNGRFVVSASDDATARVWNVTGKLQPKILGGHSGPVFSAAFSADGSKVVTGSSGEAKVWTLDAVDPPVTLNVPDGRVWAVAFNRDGTEAVTATADGRLWIWHVDWRWLAAELRRGTRACLSSEQRVRLLGETPGRAETTYRNCALSLGRL